MEFNHSACQLGQGNRVLRNATCLMQLFPVTPGGQENNTLITNQHFLQNSGNIELSKTTGAKTNFTPDNFVESPMSNDK